MSSRLQILRSQLTGLRQARANARHLSAWAAVGTVVLLALLGLFILDYLFRQQVQAPQRIALMIVAAGVVAWGWWRYAQPLVSVRETDIDMALMVERQQQIDSDLVAAIQFEDDVQGRWGSRQLETAVIEYVAQVGRDIDVFQGFNRDQLKRRATLFGIVAAVVVLAALLFPGHAHAFFNRLMLGTLHYPSATQLESLAINGREVLGGGMQPHSLRCAEGREVNFILRCAGDIPLEGIAFLSSRERAQQTDVLLTPLSAADRLARLQSARQMVRTAQQSPGLDLAGPWFEELAALVQYEAPEQWSELKIDPALPASELGNVLQSKLTAIEELLTNLIAQPIQESSGAQLFTGQLPRLNEPVSYRITLGDAYTDPAEISMIPLPAVEAHLTPEPPAYARKALAAETSGRQAAVLTGSNVQVSLVCTNKKPLQAAWMIVRPAGSMTTQRYDLKADGPGRTEWSLPIEKTPFQQVAEELRYEIQVTDDDGLHLETPVKGSVRIRPDKPPVVIASTVHRIVLPAARPTIQYRAGDDFGLKSLRLEVQVERLAEKTPVSTPGESSSAAESTEPVKEQKLETTAVNLLRSSPVTLERLPLASKYQLDLAELKLNSELGPLQKGDRLKLVVVAEDDRGGLPGETYRSEPITIDISDDLGVLGAVGEADPQAAQRIDDILKRELGIGESP